MVKTSLSDAGRLSTVSALIFACAYLPYAALQLSVAVQLPRLFATHLGVALGAVGAAFGLVRAIDIPLDPALGVIIDRSRLPWGRYRPWLILSAPILMLALYMLYEAERGVGEAYLMAWLLVLYLGMSLLLLPANSWAAALATTYKERSRLFGAMAGLGVAGALACLAIPILVAARGGGEAAGLRGAGWFLIALVPIAVGLTVFRTPEPSPRVVRAHAFRLADYARLLIRPNVMRLMAADLCITLGPGWMAALYFFFFRDSRGFDTTAANALLMIYIAAGLVGAPATAWLANAISKHRALMVTTSAYSLLLVLIFLLPKGAILPMAPAMFVSGALAAGFVVMIRAITADIGDEIRLEGGHEQIALLYALTSATTKFGTAIAIALTFSVLAAIGYDATEGGRNTPEAIRGLELAFIVGPIIFMMLGGACFLGYRLTAQRHAEIRRELEARDAQDAALGEEKIGTERPVAAAE